MDGWIDGWSVRAFADRELLVFTSPFQDSGAKNVNVILVLWCGMGMVYAFPPFRMLLAVFNKICRFQNLIVILVALRLMSALWLLSYMSIFPVLPFHWKGIHFLLKKFGCLEVKLRPDITDPQIFMPGYFEVASYEV